MNLFSKKDNQWKLCDNSTNKTKWNGPDLIEVIDIRFHVICEKVNNPSEMTIDKYVINGSAHIFYDESVAKTVLNEVNKKYGNKYTYYSMGLNIFLEDILAGHYSEVILYGKPLSDGKISTEYLVIDKQLVLENANVITIHNALASIKFGHYDKMEYYEKIKDLNMYFIGNKCLLDLPKNENGTVNIPAGAKLIIRDEDKDKTFFPIFIDEIDMKKEDGQTYRACKVYAKYYSTDDNKDFICEMPLWKIKELYNGPVIIEPHRNWWVEF